MRRQTRKRRLLTAGFALVLLAGMVLAIPGIAFAKTIEYEITFLHPDATTTTITGVTNENDTFVPNVGGTTWPDGTGMVMHLSCSDGFAGGWGETKGPDPALDPAWQVLSYTIVVDGQVECTTLPPAPPPGPAIDIEKYTNGEDADNPPGPSIPAGSTVTWSYVATNTGAVDLHGIQVFDDIEGFVGDVGVLSPGESVTFELQGVAVAGQYVNVACVYANTAPTFDGEVVDDCDASHYRQAAVGIDLEKLTNGQDADDPRGPEVAVGSTVTWTYQLTNIGDQWLWGLFLYDEQEGHITCPGRSLAPGATMTCTATGIAGAGQYMNVAWVDAWADDGTYVSDEDRSHYYGADGGYRQPAVAIDLEKLTNDRDADTSADAPTVEIGSLVEWTYQLTNVGEQTLYGIYLYDEREGHVTCPGRSLAPGDTMTCTLTGSAQRGLYENLAWVDAWGDDGTYVSDEDPSHYFGIGYGY